MSSECETRVIEQMIKYLETVLEQPHPVFGGLPICPFVKQSRLRHRISYRVIALTTAQLEADSELKQAITSFCQSQRHDVLLVISPEGQALSVEQVQTFVEQLNIDLAPLGLVCFGGHPQDGFTIGGVLTRQEPFINLTVQSRATLWAASEQLARTSYYQHWSAENLKQVGFNERSETESLASDEGIQPAEGTESRELNLPSVVKRNRDA